MKKIFALMTILSLSAIGCDGKSTTGTKPAGNEKKEEKKTETRTTPEGKTETKTEEKKSETKVTPEGKTETKTEEKKTETGPKVEPPKK